MQKIILILQITRLVNNLQDDANGEPFSWKKYFNTAVSCK